MHQCLILAALWIIAPCLFFNSAADEIFIDCGSSGTSVALDGRRWLGDTHSSVSIKGSSSRSTVTGKPTVSADPAPYATARSSRSEFSYMFKVSSGQKLIRLHFNPTSYNGFKRSKDLFTVEAAPFTLLSNFSASITADALAVNVITKEYCLVVEEPYPFNITFSPATATDHKSQDTHAFVNGIELISLPKTFSYCHIGESGVQVLGEKFQVHIDKSTAFEVVYRQYVKRDSGDDLHGMWAALLSEKENKVNTTTWRVSVDLGFRYLVRLLFCDVGLKLTEEGNTSFIVVIDQMVACTSTDILRERQDKHGLVFRDYMVMAKGRKVGRKRDITISLQSSEEFVYSHGPLKGFEIFKVSNHENSLASPNPLPPTRDSSYWIFQGSLFALGYRNAFASVLIIVICLVNIIVHMLRHAWEANFVEEERKPADSITQNCRCFFLPEIQAATENFNDEFVIGKGGFGKVYKGFIDNRREIVAIKRLKPNSKQGKREFWTEVETLSELRHVNLVSLIGYCSEQQEMILVYNYMPNGSLADHLYKLARQNSQYSLLSWEERLKICIGAGRGLDCLHTGKGVIHRDVKSSNILLDETFVEKVSDFGLAKTECVKGLHIQDSTNLKGTVGYIDPDYFRTHKLTMKSDTYAFGVVLLEVLCGRPSVDSHAGEDERSLIMLVRDNISRGEIDRIIARSLRGEISADSFKAFLGIAERCLHDDPNKRPTIAHVVMNLEIALDQQTCTYLVRNEITNVAAFLQCFIKPEPGTTTSLLPNTTDSADVLPCKDRTSMSRMQLTVASSHVEIMTSPMQKQTGSRTVNAEPSHRRKDGRKTVKHSLSRLFPWDGVWKKAKPSKKIKFPGISISAPIAKHVNKKTSSRGSSAYEDVKPTEGASKDWFKKLRIFSFSELKVATANFDPGKFLGEGGFGPVYKGSLRELSMDKNGSGSFIAIKRLDHESYQGITEWQSEVNFMGNLSHPNIVTLYGYCCEDKELLLVYEFMRRGSLEGQLFQRYAAALTWNLRIKILMGAARVLAYLHSQDKPIIYRDLKSSNILLDESYNAKLSDFGLARVAPSCDDTHVTTRVMGTYGYSAPEYISTGHLSMQSDVYSFGVVLLEMLTGVRSIDRNRPSGQHNLVEWIRPCFKSKRKLMNFMDLRLKGSYPPESAFQLFQLARTCLNKNPKARSSITEVLETLERSDTVVEKPREPKVRFSSQIVNPRNQ